ncbi:interferon-induced protein with tetratricopeptide repeats 8 [Denticeps clupeoides]|uniref:Uncharacterized protein n=1 Tax=Denticeps clupeoides TaxID=299321 RepID=A0AAY4ETI5_9TELE|nr:interferon-induced protein with tetratricopeptide repeats 1-like [Denticeps clupeoides]
MFCVVLRKRKRNLSVQTSTELVSGPGSQFLRQEASEHITSLQRDQWITGDVRITLTFNMSKPTGQDMTTESELKKLACHFNWELHKEGVDLNLLEVKFTESLLVPGQHEKKFHGCSYNFLAFVKYLQGVSDKALQILEADLEENTNHFVTFGNLACLNHLMGNDAAARSYLQRIEGTCRALPNDSPHGLQRAVLSEKAWTLLRFSKRHYSRAKDLFYDALQKEPEDREWNTGYAFSLFRLEGLEIREDKRFPFEESPAVKQLKKALKIDPRNPMIHVYLGLKCYKNKRNSEAWEYMRKAIAMAPDDLCVVLQVAKFMKKEKAFDQALQVLKRMLQKVPNSSRLHHEIANNYRWKAVAMGEPHNPRLLHRCILHMEEGIRFNPSFVYPQVELAVRYAEMKNSEKAEKMFRALFDLPDLRPADLQACHRMYGDFHLYHLGAEATAVKHYKLGMSLGNISTEFKPCHSRLLKVLDSKRTDIFGIHEFLDAFR